MELTNASNWSGRDSFSFISDKDKDALIAGAEALLPESISTAMAPILPPLREVLQGNAGNAIGWLEYIKNYIVNTLRFLGNFFAEELQGVGNAVYEFSLNLWFDKPNVEVINYSFAQNLHSVSTAQHIEKNADTKGAILNRKKLVSILEKMPHSTASDEGKIYQIIDTVNAGKSEHLGVKEWAFVSYKLDAISVDWERELERKDGYFKQSEKDYKVIKSNIKKEIKAKVFLILENTQRTLGENTIDVREVIRHETAHYLNAKEWNFVSCLLRDSIFPKWEVALEKSIHDELDSIDVVKLLGFLKADLAKGKVNLENGDPGHAKFKLKIELGIAAESKTILASNVVRRQQFVLKNLDYLKRIARLEWANLAHEKILIQLENFYKQLWKPGYVRTTSYSASVGMTVGIPLAGVTAGINAIVSGDMAKMVDDQGTYYELNLLSGGVEANIHAELTPAIQISGELDGKLSKGIQTDWESAREYAVHRFSSLIKKSEHRDDPKIARYLSRSATLANGEIKPGYVVWAATRNEVAEINALKSEYDLMKEDIEQQFSLLVSAHDQIQPLSGHDYTASSDEKPVSLTSIHVAEGAGISSGVIGYTAKGAVGGKVGLGADLTFTASGALQRKHLVQQVVVDTPLCKRLFDSKRKNEEKESIKNQIENQFNRFKDTVINSWVNEVDQTKYTKAGVDADSLRVIKSRFLFDTRVGASGGTKANTIANEIPLSAWFANLKQDFELYSHLEAGIAVRGYKTHQDQIALNKFVERYGASTAAQFLHRLVIANAYVYSQTNSAELKKNALSFEEQLLSPKFEVDQAYMKEHAYFKEDVDLENIESKFSIEVNFGEDLAGSGGSRFKIEGVKRERKRTNPLRDGEYFDIVCTAGGNLGNVNSLIKSISSGLAKNLSEDMAKKVTEQLKNKLSVIAPVGSVEYDKSYLFRFYKPRGFSEDFSYRYLFSRTLGTKEFKLGVGGTVPVGVVGASFSAGKEKIITDSESEVFGASTLLHFALYYMREHSADLIDPTTGEIDKASHWHNVVKAQEDILKRLFTNYALEVEDINNGEDGGNLSQEIAEIEDAINAGHDCVDRERLQFRFNEAKILFQNAVDAFARDALSKAKFEEALTCFQNLLNEYHPQWEYQKANSALFIARPLPEVEMTQAENDAATLATLRRAAAQQKALRAN